MKKRGITIIICLALAASFCTGALASGNMQAISAYLNSGIRILYNGQAQTMKDAKGNTVYPISYNGTTYVPIRAVSDILNLPVVWDGTNNAVILGTNPEGTNFIENMTPYGGSESIFYKASDGNTISLAGNTYSGYILMWKYDSDVYYNLNGKYTTLTFQLYSKHDAQIVFKGDNDALLATFNTVGGALPVTCTVNLTDVQRLDMKCVDGTGLYLVNATIK